MFASRVTKEVPIAEGTATITTTIRKLSARSLEKASQIRQQAAFEALKGARADIMEVLNKPAAADTPQKPKKKFEEFDAAERRTAFYATYDRATVLRAGLQSWASSDTTFDLPPIETGIEDLDEQASDSLFIAIMDLSIPPVDVVKAAESKD